MELPIQTIVHCDSCYFQQATNLQQCDWCYTALLPMIKHHHWGHTVGSLSCWTCGANTFAQEREIIDLTQEPETPPTQQLVIDIDDIVIDLTHE